jgi:AsmA protein
MSLAKSEAGAEAKADMQLTDVDLDACLGELFGLRRVEGKGNLSFAFEGAGRSVLTLTRNLSGTASLTSAQGAITGVNVEQVLRRLERRPLSGGDYRSGRTPYDKLNVALKVANGIVTIDDAIVDGPSVRVTLGGSAAIPTRELDLKGTASLLSSPKEVAFELPFFVYGPWDEAMPLPDAQSLISRSDAAGQLLRSLHDSKTRDAVQSAIKRLTGQRPEPQPAAAPPPVQ